MEREEFFKRYCGLKKEDTLLKQTPTDRTLMQLVRYNRMHERVFKYQKTIPENWLINKIYQDIKLILYFCC